MLHGWDSWKAAADWADTEIKSLATEVVEAQARQVQAAVGGFSPGGKTPEKAPPAGKQGPGRTRTSR